MEPNNTEQVLRDRRINQLIDMEKWESLNISRFSPTQTAPI
jgi:hypothetical protein